MGKKFGRLVVVSPTSGRKHREVMWLCDCACGQQVIVQRQHLLQGITKSCGCLVAEYNKGKGTDFLRTLAEKRKLPLGISNMRALLYSYKSRARKNGLRFGLTAEQFKKLTQQECFYCGIEPKQIARCVTFTKGYKHERHGDYVYNGIDRLDNSKGYSVDNSVACCKYCNISKRDRSVGDFLDWVRKIYDYRIV